MVMAMVMVMVLVTFTTAATMEFTHRAPTAARPTLGWRSVGRYQSAPRSFLPPLTTNTLASNSTSTSTSTVAPPRSAWLTPPL
jgi:hypothetical protein